MDQSPLTKVSARTAAEVCGSYKPSKKSMERLKAGFTPLQFVEALAESRQYLDAFDFLAHALPKREAIWWACLAVRHAQGPALPPKECTALKAAVQWVLEPDETRRRAAQEAGTAAEFSTPAGLAALAVYGSGGSLGPAKFPEVPPEPYMTAQAVSGSLALASVRVDPQSVLEVQRELVELGLAIAREKLSWPSVTETPVRSSRTESAPANRF
jgi:hypothetical protein